MEEVEQYTMMTSALQKKVAPRQSKASAITLGSSKYMRAREMDIQ